MRKGLLPAVVVTALLALYTWAVIGRAWALIDTGKAVGVGIGIAVLVLPLLVLFVLIREWHLAVQVQSMADELAAAEELPVDSLPRSPGGRIDRIAADEAFGEMRARVEAEPTSWKAWYDLAFAYDASHDRSRARSSLRKAASLRKASARETLRGH